MRTSKVIGKLGFGAIGAALMLAPAIGAAADMGERAIWARTGYMNLVSWTAGPLFGMAKGDLAYDAETAKTQAELLQKLYEYPFPSLFVAGTAKPDRPGKTRALPEIWQNPDKFQATFDREHDLATTLVDEVGKGQAALAAAVGELGKGCGGCHSDFRAKDY